MKISGKQIAMARILLDLNQKDLADRLGMARKTIMRIENGQSPGSSTTLEKIQLFFENNGLEFTDGDGVKKSASQIVTLRGSEGLRTFIDQVYEYAKTHGGIMCLHNAKPDHWNKWLPAEWYAMHSERMQKIAGKYEYRITSEHGNTNFISKAFAEYRWFPPEYFSDQPIYAFGDILAFVSFREDRVVIRILKNVEFSKGFQALFNIAWDRVAIKPPKS